jgi:hypothetical protein
LRTERDTGDPLLSFVPALSHLTDVPTLNSGAT